jgi:hypothetical protein
VWDLILVLLNLPVGGRKETKEGQRKRLQRVESFRWPLYAVILGGVLVLVGAWVAIWLAG